MELPGAVAIVTGGARGIGRAIGEALLKQRCKVMLADMKVEEGAETCSQLRRQFGRENVSFQRCDVTEAADLKDLYKTTVRTYDRLDIVCNSAGVGFERSLNGDMWFKTIDINLTAVIHSTFLASDYMSTTKGGRGGVVINIASMGGMIPMPQTPVYCGSKHGVIGFCRSTSLWPHEHGVYCYALCPSFVRTPLLESGFENVPGMKEYVESIGTVPAEKVAEGVIQLCQTRPKSGSVMRVTAARGIDFEKFRSSRL